MGFFHATQKQSWRAISSVPLDYSLLAICSLTVSWFNFQPLRLSEFPYKQRNLPGVPYLQSETFNLFQNNRLFLVSTFLSEQFKNGVDTALYISILVA